MTASAFQLPILWLLLCFQAGALGALLLTLRKQTHSKMVLLLSALGVGCALVVLAIRAGIMRALPFSNGMDFALWLIVILLGMYIYGTQRLQWGFTGILVLPMTILLTAWMLQLDMEVYPLQPALRSIWLAFHVSTAIIAYASFAMACVFSLLLLFYKEGKHTMLSIPDQSSLDHWSYKLAMIGLPFLTIMLITGAVWAEYAWGRFWSWDPKETWALITWLIYAAYLHLRLRGWKGQKAAIVNGIGFAAVIFTFFGVSYLLPGLHSYM